MWQICCAGGSLTRNPMTRHSAILLPSVHVKCLAFLTHLALAALGYSTINKFLKAEQSSNRPHWVMFIPRLAHWDYLSLTLLLPLVQSTLV